MLKKIVLIGPVFPYKGGISHYTGLMYRALASKYDVTMMSYSLQYPKILFKKEQRDYSNDSLKSLILTIRSIQRTPRTGWPQLIRSTSLSLTL